MTIFAKKSEVAKKDYPARGEYAGDI